MMDKLPGARPVCEHGHSVGGMYSCKECHKRDTAIKLELQPLADSFWERRGEWTVEYLLFRAYRMGMRHKGKR